MDEDGAEVTGSTLPRRQLGRFLREAREGAGLTLEKAATLMEWGKATLQRIEKGTTEKVRVRDVLSLCEIYGLSESKSAIAKGLAEQAPVKSWWQTYSGSIATWFNLYVGLEAGAKDLAQFQPLIMPGLLQTTAYARAVDRLYFTDESEEELDRRAEVRAQRQNILTRSRNPTTAAFVLHESMLRTVVGDHRVMAAQYRHIADLSTHDNIDVRVMPFRAGLPLGTPLPPFIILDFGRDVRGKLEEPPVVYCESYAGSVYLEEQSDVARFRRAFKIAQGASLDPRSSRDLLREIAKGVRE
ncbi:helix-turn-helix domain-containing protein [Nocardia sp. CA-128927]|uniref:helix-turn-helix domain-containing protein n=1 Tax=Nocardia sp. CA-128927 TaxID=3239975 RepID=UPI003D979088